MKTKLIAMFAALIALLVLSGCRDQTKNTRFEMPAGDAERGRAAFVALECYTCHRVSGVELPPPTVDLARVVVLGGDVYRLRTYGDLITSIIHPTRDVSDLMRMPLPEGSTQSPMQEVNDQMTFTQLIDLVTFLQPRYQRLEPLYHPNPIYGP
jgi:sulfur-oxidizing protein SoxX